MKLFLALVAGFMLVLITGNLKAQDPDQRIELMRANIKGTQVISSTPEAAELGKYGNTPVNLATGNVNINIPLYELKGTDISLPVSLSFNASGFKPQDKATWVGQGWSLNAAGVITRSVRGNPDDAHYFGHPEAMPSSSDYFSYFKYLSDIRKGEIETQPDLYYYNFNQNSGKFGLTKGSFPNAIKEEEDLIKIAPSTSGLEYFTATDLKGISYTFDQKENVSLVYDVDVASSDATTIRTFSYPGSWFVSKMSSFNNREEIRFEYYTTSSYQMNAHQQPSAGVARSYLTTQNASPGGGSSVTYSTDGTVYASPGQTMTTTRIFLKKISLYRDGKQLAYIDFISDTQRDDAEFSEDRVLKGIRIYSSVTGQEQLVKSYDFKYGYYANPNQTYDNKRLRLDTLQEQAVVSGTTSPKPYTFEYYGGNLPSTYTYGIDHWGFYNATNNGSLIPTVYFTPPNQNFGNSIGQGANRDPNLSGSRYAMINKINYPTGGYTTFEYELNDSYDASVNATRSIGGIRISKVIDYAGANQPAIAKRYRYVSEEGNSSGVSDNNYPKYLTTSSWKLQGNLPPLYNGSRLTNSLSYNVSGNAVYGLASFPGGHVGYRRVEEQVMDALNNNIVYTNVYEYNFNTPNRFIISIANGDLLRQTKYDNGGNILEQTTNTYSYPATDQLDYIAARPAQSQNNQTNYCFQSENEFIAYDSQENNTPTSCWKFATYPQRLQSDFYTTIRTQKRLLTSSLTRTYDKLTGKYLVNSTTNEYVNGGHIFPVKITQYTGGKEQLVTRRRYIADGPFITDGGYGNMAGNNLMSAEIESYQYREDTLHQQQRVVGGKVTYYGPECKPVKVFQLEISSPLALSSYTPLNAVNNSIVKDTRYKPLFDLYYNNANLVTQQKSGDVPKSYIWDYNNLLPTAEVINSDTVNIAYTSFESVITGKAGGWQFNSMINTGSDAYTGTYSGSLAAGRSITKSFPAATGKILVVSYWAKGGTVAVMANNSSISPAVSGPARNGWNFYEYRIPAGATLISITGTGLIDELRCCPVDAQMNTYTYKPFVGMSASTSAQNLTSKFEFDGLNRLITVRDEKNNILQRYTYAYGANSNMAAAPATLFYNNRLATDFTKNSSSCPTGSEPSTETYVVPYGKYISHISQQDADNKAQQDVTANGQQFANNVGICWFYNDEVFQFFQKTNCGDAVLRSVKYTVPARTYKSLVSKAAANALAQADLEVNGPDYANSHGTCPCDDLGEGYKNINGNCIKGTKSYLYSTPKPGGGYICTYRYEFPDGTHSVNYTENSSSICYPI